MKKDTKDKILAAATTLMTERGYSNVSVKDIASTAGVSEMTVFRHYETKLGILQAVLHHHSYIPYFEHLFAQELSGDLANDLQQIANTYLAFMEKNKPIFLITTQDRSLLPGLMDTISDNQTKQLLQLLAAYFQSQIEQGRMKEIDTKGQAIVFLTSLFGFFVSNALWDYHFLKDQRDTFVHNLITNFVSGVIV
ncbi:TetR/AcrR family transcriptional regulator [Lysinibacillus irui]|uniref:TetR/AcrR family transcriptional regulator n=1 Tax=Lysinibacillus irui TaxID=2998077 RepID=A0AAJ5RHY2_9BACI|nr:MULTISPECIES: TetR/AcrR family transcriptional regulator [Lysinibacillus]MEA0555907.1 TetR/AcrR family transcriptional regulator [Lysinibacillus irui]MEA0563621.1 TetR/AcrR family transcriptional regulator [Lysinibacillus irui]MEA0976211.1 TetR/AcrR family transcriptional regulator [Lysinibacillus irui]MEA1042365.1 TetR/AcrR family transcriptional regulator [Lysinibacillus irui]WDV05316.1 TetR/AcrR family transcriptional regulator [Lysinibacillus irui]